MSNQAQSKVVKQIAQYPGAKSLRAVLRQLLLNETEVSIAARLGVTQSWVSDHVTGRRKSIQRVVRGKVAAGLGLSLADLSVLTKRRH